MAPAKADNSKVTWSRASQGRHDEEELCSEATGAPWKSPLLPLDGHVAHKADVCIGGVLRCHSKRKNKRPRVGGCFVGKEG